MKTMRGRIAAVAIGAAMASSGVGASPAQAEYLSAPDARYYARDAVRTSIPNAIRVTANCGARRSSSFFVCSVSWRKPYKPKRYGTVRVRAIEGNHIRSVFIRTS